MGGKLGDHCTVTQRLPYYLTQLVTLELEQRQAKQIS